MHAASVLRAAVRKPSIHFLGKRSLPSSPHKAAAHPLAPEGFDFAAFSAKSGSGSGSSASAESVTVSSGKFIPLYPASKKPYDYLDFEAPAYLRHRPEMTEREIEAIMSGGATDIRTGA